jgi:hypothetical protein
LIGAAAVAGAALTFVVGLFRIGDTNHVLSFVLLGVWIAYGLSRAYTRETERRA